MIIFVILSLIIVLAFKYNLLDPVFCQHLNDIEKFYVLKIIKQLWFMDGNLVSISHKNCCHYHEINAAVIEFSCSI